jgi:hypothetical protein
MKQSYSVDHNRGKVSHLCEKSSEEFMVECPSWNFRHSTYLILCEGDLLNPADFVIHAVQQQMAS